MTLYAVYINNQGYPVSLKQWKIYQVLQDLAAASGHMVRVVDESGEDCLYPEDYFIPIDLPQIVIEKLALAV